MHKFEVEFYETPNGDQPAKEFLLSLDKKRVNHFSCGMANPTRKMIDPLKLSIM